MYQRTIDFNSGVFLFGPPSPDLVIAADASGTNPDFTTLVGMTAPVFNSATDTWDLPNIVNNATAQGTAQFYIPAWSDDPNPAGYATHAGRGLDRGQRELHLSRRRSTAS